MYTVNILLSLNPECFFGRPPTYNFNPMAVRDDSQPAVKDEGLYDTDEEFEVSLTYTCMMYKIIITAIVL